MSDLGDQPNREDYATAEEYRQAWYTWRAIRWDGLLNAGEREAIAEAAAEHLGVRIDPENR